MAIITESKILQIINLLKQYYPEAECALKFQNVFQLLIAVMLSAQTTDKIVNKVTPTLFTEYPDSVSIASMDPKVLENILKPIGLYRTKARHMIELCKKLEREYGGQVPAKYEDLVALPGVGRKTANVVLAVGFGRPRIAVDTHVFRVSNRIGLVEEKNVLNTELSLMKAIPQQDWVFTHHALIWHGRKVCGAKKPMCTECVLSELCNKNGLNEMDVK